jgi:hypothetical protein
MKSYITDLLCGGTIKGIRVTKWTDKTGKIDCITEEQEKTIESLTWFKEGRIWELDKNKVEKTTPIETVFDKHFTPETLELVKANFKPENYQVVVDNVAKILETVCQIKPEDKSTNDIIPNFESVDYKKMQAEYEVKFGKKAVGISKVDLYNTLYENNNLKT